MPNFDQAGPQGQGKMTGRGLGNCSKKVQGVKLGLGQGRGLGRGRGIGLGKKMSLGLNNKQQ